MLSLFSFTAIAGTSVTLSWQPSFGATRYEYCIDRTANATCDTYWVSTGSATSVLLTSLAPGSGYSWQVRAVNGGGTTIAGGGWWGFTTPGTLGLNADVTIDFGSTYGLYTLYDFAASPAWQNRHPLSPTKLAAGDLDGNGVQDAGEPGIAGVTVNLSGPGGPLSTTTDGTGKYQFTGLVPGTYTVSVVAPAGYVATKTGQGTAATDSNANNE